MLTKGQAIYYRDGQQITEDEATDDNGTLLPGVSLRVPMMMCDSAGRLLVDGLGQPLPEKGRRSGYVFAQDAPTVSAEQHDYNLAELSNRWRGGLKVGDQLMIDGHLREVTEFNDDGTQVCLDAVQLGDEVKQQAYDASVNELTNAWRKRPTSNSSWNNPSEDDKDGVACLTTLGQHGTWRKDKNGKYVCKVGEREPSAREWEISGPLSDARSIKDAAYEKSCRNLENAWRK